MNGTIQVVASLAGSLISGGGAAWMISALTRRHQSREPVTNAVRLSDAALRQLDLFQRRASAAEESADRARKEADAAREDAAATRTLLLDVRNSLAVMSRELKELVDMIHEPAMTLERLRRVVPRAKNGRSHEH